MKPRDLEQRSPVARPITARGDFRHLAAASGLFLESLLPALLPAAGVLAGFVILAWLGVFTALGPIWRLALTGFAALALAFAARPLLRVRFPGRAAIARRLDRSRPDFHRPLATLADSYSIEDDPMAAALWQRHRQRAEASARELRAGPADPQLRQQDRFALRAGALVALVAAGFVAGDERSARLALAFDWTTPQVPPAPPRLDAWIDPPAYTGRPPIFLSGTNTVSPDEVIRAPVGSVITIRTTSVRVEGKAPVAARLELEHGAGLIELPDTATRAPGEDPKQPQPGVGLEKRTLRADSALKVRRDGREIAGFRLAVIPDMPPHARLDDVKIEAAMPDRQQPGGVRLTYALEDDYGIGKGEIFVERVRPAVPGAGAPLFPAPALTLPLRLGAGDLLIQTEEHPWAGEEVRISLRVEDDIGQVSQSAGRTIILPQRPFSQPLPRALVEQRRKLNFSPDETSAIRLAFDSLLFAPERFTPKVSDFIALDMIRTSLRTARSRDRLKELVEEIYALALFLENGDMTDAERRLREAEARLRDALERNASADEIKRLTEELRRAMDQFLREFAERALRDQNAQDRAPISPDRMLTQRDMADMLRKIEELARSGKTAEARELLNQLKQALENLRSARRRDVDPRTRELGQQLEELDRLQREQRDLRDRTFREGQRGQQRQGQQQQGQQQQGNEQGLKDQQQALRDRLNRLRERLRQRGMEEGKGFGEAENGMEDAEGKLGQGQNGPATEGQQRALDGLGQAAEGMARELQRQLGQGNEPGEGEGEGFGEPGPGQRGRADSRFDPLGRPNRRNRGDAEDSSRLNEGDKNGVPGSVSERAERVLQELRRRLGEFERPREELDYLERLLRQR